MTLSNSQSSSGNSNSDVLIHRTSSNSRNSGSSGGGQRRNNCERAQNSKINSSQYQNRTAGEPERNSRGFSSTMPTASARSYSNSDMTTIDQSSTTDHVKSKDSYLDDRLYQNASDVVDPTIVCRGSTSSIRYYTRSALYLLRNDTRSRCRPKCASKLQLLCIWKTNNSNYSNCNQQNGGHSNNSSNSSNTMEMSSSSLSSPRMSSNTRQQNNHDLQCSGNGSSSSSHHNNQKNYLDHRSISSSHLMPAFAKRRIGNSASSNSGNSSTISPSLAPPNDSLKLQTVSGKNNDHKHFLSPQRKNVTLNQMSKSVQVYSNNSLDGDGDHDRERGRDREHERDVNFNPTGSSLSNARERRIGSGRLLPRDVNWDYRSEKEPNATSISSGSNPFEKDLSSHSSTGGNNNIQRVSSSSIGNQNSSNQRFDYTHRSPSSKDRNSGGGKNSSEYRPESRYESRRSYARGEYERDSRGDNSNYVRRFMSDLINQNTNNNFSGKSGSPAVSGGCGQSHNENRRRNHRNDEPEWFSSGPTSQHDTIELRGFDEMEDSNSNSSSSGIGEGKHNKSNASKQYTRRNRVNNSQIGARLDISSKEKERSDSENKNMAGVHDGYDQKSSSPIASNTPRPKSTEHFKSDTNNNSKQPRSGFTENKTSALYDELASSTATSDKKTDEIKIIIDNDAKKDSSYIPAPSMTTNNQTEDKATGFNFDVFLNVDPLSNLLMGEQSTGENEAGSRFSRWFVKQGDNLKMCDEGLKTQFSEEMVSLINESQVMKNERKPSNASESTNANQSNTLMEFLQRGKMNAAAGNTDPISNVGSIPSVKELEARMRKVGEETTNSSREQPVLNTNDTMNNPLNQFLTNSVHHHQQQQKQLHFMIKNENNQAVSIHNILGVGPHIQQQQHLQINHTHHSGHLAPSQTQDMEAFKKLLEQITPTTLNAVKLPTQNTIQQLAPPQQPHMHRLPPLQQPINILTTIGSMPPPTPQHLMKNDELTKFIHQQQLHQRRQPHVMSGPQHPQMNQSTQNEIPIVQAMFLAPQQRFEAQLLLQGLSRGEVTQSTLGHQLSNPNTSPRTKEVLAAVLRETSRDTSPNVIMSAPQIMSPVLGQSHCASTIPPPPPPIIMPNPQQLPINHPPQPGTQQPHPPSGTNAGGLPQRIPSPRELQYHTQSIMQNALIKKKLEEQQENFRRRQELQKQQQQMQHKSLQSPSHVEINEFGVLVGPQQQQYSSNQQHQKKTQQQQQIIQGQQQQRHINSPTPLAFTPTSVLRKMTAEKDSVSSFHTSAPTTITTAVAVGTATSPLVATSTMVAGNVGTNNTNPNKPMHSVLMHYQQQQQTNSSQNQPRMILGVGSHSQQQQPSVAIITGPAIQQPQQHPENSRLNQTLRNNQIKWPGAIMNQISITKPMGRPILKGSLTQSIPPPANPGLNPIQQQQQQSQTISQSPQMAFASKIEFQQIQQQRITNNQQQQPHPQKQQQPQLQSMPPPQQSQNILMTQLYQQQQRAALQRAQQYQLHQLHQQQQQMNIIQNNSNRPVDRIVSNVNTSQPVSSCNNIINFQRDGGLSPTSNQLARWFSPELLAQASAGKLPPLNMNQALSLEEFEKSIQHSSTAVNN